MNGVQKTHVILLLITYLARGASSELSSPDISDQCWPVMSLTVLTFHLILTFEQCLSDSPVAFNKVR